jgi:DNA-binding LacI/PurR family transcriptional regulator
MAKFAIRCQSLIQLRHESQARNRAVSTDRSTRPSTVTLHDVAQEADVAVSTVSRALSNPDRVSRSTREHVQTVARRLGYRSNRAAGRTQMLALLVHDITNPYNFGLIRGAEAQARAAGYTLVLGDTQQSSDLESIHAERLRSSVDGVVLGSSRLSDERLRELAGRTPAVLFNRELAGLPSVVMDSVDGSRQIIEHLAALGHRSIAYLAGPRNVWTDDERWRTLASVAAELGVEIARLGPFVPTLEQGVAAGDVGLASGASAFVAFNDLLAIGALQRLERRGVDVPGEISVVGYDDIFGSDFCHPPLTTVTGPVEEAGRALVDLLLGSIGVDSAVQVILPTQLRVRDSTGPASHSSRASRQYS